MAEEELDENPVDKLDDQNYGLILPDTQRVRDKQDKARKLRQKIEEEKEKKKKSRLDEENRQKRQREKRELAEKEAQKRKADEQKNKEDAKYQIENNKGNLMELYQTIYRNTSPFELAFANYNMAGTNEFSLLMTILEDNTSLLTLSLSRKNLTDNEGIKLADMLSKNKKLRRLELEGNFLGPDTAKAFGKALTKNVTLRYLDLENNNLTNHGEDVSGIHDLLESLRKNKMLISLNISNNFLTYKVGDMIESLLTTVPSKDDNQLPTNGIIIHLEFFGNKDFKCLTAQEQAFPENEGKSKYQPTGLYIEKVNRIKKALKDNYDAYMKMRTDEWKERKGMTSNYEDTEKTRNTLEARKLQEDTRNAERKYIETLFLDNFNQHVKDIEDKFNDAVNKYFAETKERLTKKKKRKGKKKK